MDYDFKIEKKSLGDGAIDIDLSGSTGWTGIMMRITRHDGSLNLSAPGVFVIPPIIFGGLEMIDESKSDKDATNHVIVDDPRVVAVFGRLLLNYAEWIRTTDLTRCYKDACQLSRRILDVDKFSVPTGDEIQDIYTKLQIPREYDPTRDEHDFYAIYKGLGLPGDNLLDGFNALYKMSDDAYRAKGPLMLLVDGRLVRLSDIPKDQMWMICNPAECLQNALELGGNATDGKGKFFWKGCANSSEAIGNAQELFDDSEFHYDEEIDETQTVAAMRKEREGDAYVPSKDLAGKPTFLDGFPDDASPAPAANAQDESIIEDADDSSDEEQVFRVKFSVPRKP